MNRDYTNICRFRHLLLSVSLLWALLLYGQGAVASQPKSTPSVKAAGTEQVAPNSSEEEALTLRQVVQYLAEDATASAISIPMPQAAATAAKLTFAFPADEAIPPYAARAPGVSFLSKFFPTSIQPKAP